MPGSEYQSHAHPGHVPAPGQQTVYELETTPAAPRACHHNGFPNRDESGTLLKSPSIRSRQAPFPKNTLMNWRWLRPFMRSFDLQAVLGGITTLRRRTTTVGPRRIESFHGTSAANLSARVFQEP